MKKLIFLSFLASFALSAELFSDKIINLYLDTSDKKPSGKLLPTNAFTASKISPEFSKVEISGFYTASKPNTLYFTDYNRILVAAFSKKAKLEIVADKPNEKGFSKAKITVFAKTSELATATKNNEENFKKAKNIFSENCGTCHALHDTAEFSANQWPSNFKAMQSRAAIEKDDVHLITQYLQKHAKDMK